MYRVELLIGGEPVASGKFEIVDNQLPHSGPFSELRAGLTWAAETLSREELSALLSLARLTAADERLGFSVASLPWFNAGPADRTLQAFLQFVALADTDIELARRIAGLRWFADGITEDEWLTLRSLSLMATVDLASARSVTGLQWIHDEVTKYERENIERIGKLVDRHSASTRKILASPWMRDYLSEIESSLLVQFSRLINRDVDLAAQLADMNFMIEPVTDLHVGVVRSLVSLYDTRRNSLDDIVAQPWFADGLHEDEAALVSVLHTLASSDVLLEEVTDTGHARSYAVRSYAVQSPLRGSVGLHVVHRDGVRMHDETIHALEEAVQVIEGFVGAPWPAVDIVLLLEPDITLANDERVKGAYEGYYIATNRLDTEPEFMGTLYHELTHYYFNSGSGGNGPIWLREGIAEFMGVLGPQGSADYDLARRAETLLGETIKNCHAQGVRSIQELNEATVGLSYDEARALPLWLCHFSLGEYFFVRLYDLLGRAPISGALRELYLLARSENRPVTEEEIYRAFLTNTPSEKVADFSDLYQKIHGGAIPTP